LGQEGHGLVPATRGWWDLRPCPDKRAGADDATVAGDLLAPIWWGALLLVFVIAAILIGRLTARLFLRATGARLDKR
jgi:hypothetical protein